MHYHDEMKKFNIMLFTYMSTSCNAVIGDRVFVNYEIWSMQALIKKPQ